MLVGAGAAPRTELAEAAGLPVRNGLLVNEQLEAVGAAGVYAAGDVAAAWHPRYQSLPARRALGQRAQPGPGRGPQHARHPHPLRAAALLLLRPVRPGHGVLGVRGRPGTGWWSAATRRLAQFIAFWLKDQRVVAGMNANVWDVTEPIQALIRGGLPVDPARLADPDIPLDQVTSELVTTSTR